MSDELVYRPARQEDLPDIGAVFRAAFPESLEHYFAGHEPSEFLLSEPFNLFLAAEPAAFLVASTAADGVIGYIFAPARTDRLARVAFSRGFAARWAWFWISGRYGIGLAPLKVLTADTLQFFRTTLAPDQRVPARILSVAVHPEYAGGGVGTELCRMALARFDRLRVGRVRLEVRPDNEPARRMYEGLGFEEAGRTRDGQGEWLVMTRSGPASGTPDTAGN
ncbi:MAG: N-acetyltransferase [Thermaerobacterales bacterium]